MRELIAVIPLLFVALILGGCGSDDGDGSSGTDLDATALTKNLAGAGYTVDQADEQGLTAQPDPTRVENVVTVLLYDGGDDAQKAFDDLGGETDNRKLAGNGIYMYGGGVSGTPSTKLQPVIDAAQG